MRETGSSSLQFWMTPNARDWKDTYGQTAMRQDGKTRIDQLPRQLFAMAGGLFSATNQNKAGTLERRKASLSVASSTDAPSQTGRNTQRTASNQESRRDCFPRVNPEWVETLMGLPIGWTASVCSATESAPPKPPTPSAPLPADWPI